MTETEEQEIPFVVRRRFEEANIPWPLRWGSPAVYLAAWSEARREGRPMSVGAACQAAGFSPDALRQRRRANADFRQAELWARRGVPYTPPDEPEPEPEPETALDVVVPEITITNTTLYRHPAMTAPPKVTLQAGVPTWASYRDYDEEF